MTDEDAELLLMIIGGVAIGGIIGKRVAGSTFLGMLAGGATAAVLGPRVIRALEQRLDRRLTATELRRLEAAIRDE